MSEDSSSKDIVAHTHTHKEKTKGWGVPGGLVITAAAFLGPQFALVGIAPVLAPLLQFYGNNLQSFVLQMLFQLMVIGFILLALRSYKTNLADFGFGKIKGAHVQLAVLGFIAYFVLTIALNHLITNLFLIPDEAQDLGYMELRGFEFFLAFLSLCIVTPIAEEFLFRGFLFKGLRSKLGFYLTTFVVSIIFAIAHGQLNVAIDVFVLSLVLCYVREKSGSLWPAIFVHALKNSVAFLLLFIYNVQ